MGLETRLPPEPRACASRQRYVPATVRDGDRLLGRLAALRSVLVLPLCRAASLVLRHEAWRSYGHLSRGDFARERLQRDGRWLGDLVRLHRTLEELPELGPALCGADGGRPLGQVAALQIGRVARREDVRAWLERARRVSFGELRSLVRAARGVSGALGGSVGGVEEDEDEPRVVVRQLLPPDVKWMFESAFDLYRTVEGGEASRTSFVQALVGEATSSGCGPLEDFGLRYHRSRSGEGVWPVGGSGGEGVKGRRARPGMPEGRAEARREWEGMAAVADSGQGRAERVRAARTPAVVQALRRLESFEKLRLRLLRLERKLAGVAEKPERPSSRTRLRDLERLVRVLESLLRLEDGLELDMGDLLLELHEHRAWEALGYAGLESYAEECLGLGGSTARRRVSLARDLRRLWEVRAAYARGEIGFLRAQWVSRKLRGKRADSGEQKRWIALSRQATVKWTRDEERQGERVRLLKQVEFAEARTPGSRGPARGEAAAEPAGEAATGHGVCPEAGTTAGCEGSGAGDEGAHFSPSSETAGRGGLDSGAPAGVRSARLKPSRLARSRAALAALERPMDEATWRAALRRIPGETREQVLRLGYGLLDRVCRKGPLLEVPLCLELPELDASNLLGCIATARRGLEALRTATPGDASQLPPSGRIAGVFADRGERLPSWVGLLAILEEWVWVQDEPRSLPRRPGERTLGRDGYRCMAPGCTSRRNLQVHHLVHRAWGGGDEDENLLTLCLPHHQEGEHGGLARCRGRAPLDVVWRLGCEKLATWYRNEWRLDGQDGETN